VFERSSPRASSCEPYRVRETEPAAALVLAGFAGEAAFLSTLIDASTQSQGNISVRRLGHHARDDVSADEIHRAVSKISGLYGEVYETTDWITSTLPRKLGVGKKRWWQIRRTTGIRSLRRLSMRAVLAEHKSGDGALASVAFSSFG